VQRLNKRGITIALVTHEVDIAACSRRIIRMRDGRIHSDTPQVPHDAAAAIAALPASDEHVEGGVSS